VELIANEIQAIDQVILLLQRNHSEITKTPVSRGNMRPITRIKAFVKPNMILPRSQTVQVLKRNMQLFSGRWGCILDSETETLQFSDVGSKTILDSETETLWVIVVGSNTILD
ncbi:hypothetical protein DNTS_030099, partial [Danionella cerebrum]